MEQNTSQIQDERARRFMDASDDYVAPPADKVVPGDFRARILLPGQAGRLIDDFAGDIARDLRDKSIFNRGGIAAVIAPDRGKPIPISPTTFRSWLENLRGGNLVCEKFVGRGESSRKEDASMSEECAKATLSSPRFLEGIRPLARLNTIRLPVRRENETVELLPIGYDAQSKTFTIKTATYDESMPVEAAKTYLNSFLASSAFNPIDKERSLSATLAMMLAPFCDCMFDRFAIRPAFIVGANTEGAGKTMAVQMAVTPIFGTTRLTAPPSADNADKLNELLNSVAQSGVQYVVFDNWRGKIEHGGLEAFMTAPTLSGRVLGTSHTFEVDKSCLVFITANHATVGSDMRRRSIFIQLFVEEARSEDRLIAHPLSEADIIRARDKILASLWALVRSWRDAGCKPGSVRNASFDEWGKTIGGILEFAGYVSPLLPPPDPLDDRLHNMTELVRAVANTVLGGAEIISLRPEDLLKIAREQGCFPTIVAADEPDERKLARAESQQLGKQFARYMGGRVFQIGAGERIRFTVIGSGHTREYRFARLPK